ncbi:hypothetical protein VCHENC02_2608A, partial [Vibrio harveyi]
MVIILIFLGIKFEDV